MGIISLARFFWVTMCTHLPPAVVADHPVALENIQKFPERGPVARCGVAHDAPVAFEHLGRQQILAQLVVKVELNF